MLPHLEQFESCFEEELKWMDEALIALEEYKNVHTVEEVERELARYSVRERCLLLVSKLAQEWRKVRLRTV